MSPSFVTYLYRPVFAWGIAVLAGCASDAPATPENDGRTEDAGVGHDASTEQQQDAATEQDASFECHRNGEPFTPPNGIVDPFHLLDRIEELCCDDPAAGAIVIVETPRGGVCERADPLQFACVVEVGDSVCGPDENFCTSPLGCLPPDPSFPVCCGEGDMCQGLDPDYAPSGVHTCCPGLEMIPFGFWNEEVEACVEVPFPDAALCSRGCGDGQCTIAENECNCPEDCGTRD